MPHALDAFESRGWLANFQGGAIRLAANALHFAGGAMTEWSMRLAPAPSPASLAVSRLEFHPGPGATGFLHADGKLAGRLPGVTRL